MWKTLPVRAFAGRRQSGSPTRSLPAHRRKEAQHRANCPHLKIPGTHSGMPGIFCSALIGGMPERHFRFPQQLPQKVENSLYGLLPGAGGLLTSPLTSGASPQGRTAPGKLPPFKNPRHSHWNAGDFSALMGTIPEGHFPFPQQLPQKVENSTLFGLLPDAGGLLTDPLAPSAPPRGGAAPGQLPPSENPRHSLWNAGDFLSIYSCCTGVTSARRSHGLPL